MCQEHSEYKVLTYYDQTGNISVAHKQKWLQPTAETVLCLQARPS
jgi:hypothetical protein